MMFCTSVFLMVAMSNKPIAFAAGTRSLIISIILTLTSSGLEEPSSFFIFSINAAIVPL